ncbi:MAG TPA: tRNA adenosine deaminase-associated protein [Micromonosporaceae bacterium]
MSHFAAAVVRSEGQWSASELSLTDAADVQDVADRLRDADPSADVALLFVESDDAYLTILRLDEGEDLRVFSSDAAFADESRVGALLLGESPQTSVEIDAELTAPPTPDAEPAKGAADPGDPGLVEPAGDPALLADLGVPATHLLALCANEDLLPSDVTAEVCMAIGAGDDVEELREA